MSQSLTRRIGKVGGRVLAWADRRTAELSPQFARSEITWKCTQRLTWVAMHADEFVGMVEEDDGMFVANHTGRGTYNTYRTLSEAMQAFERPNAGSIVVP